MTAATHAGERWCSQHHGPRSECRPTDRHVISGRASDELMAKVEAVADAVGLTSKNDALEMALEAWAELPLREIAEQALATKRIRRLPRGLSKPPAVSSRSGTGTQSSDKETGTRGPYRAARGPCGVPGTRTPRHASQEREEAVSGHDHLGIDIPHLRLTPGGWLATALDSPRIGVVGREKADALELFTIQRAEWRRLIAMAERGDEPTGIGWPR